MSGFRLMGNPDQDLLWLRHRLDLSQGKLANLLGCSLVSISRWESGAGRPTGSAGHLIKALRIGLSAGTSFSRRRAAVFVQREGGFGMVHLISKLVELSGQAEGEKVT